MSSAALRTARLLLRIAAVFFNVFLQLWIERIKGDPTKDLAITDSSKICSAYFLDEDYKFTNSKKKNVKDDACPSVEEKREDTTSQLGKTLGGKENTWERGNINSFGRERIFETLDEQRVNMGIEANLQVDYSHKMSLSVLISKCTTRKKEIKLFSLYTGFRSHSQFVEF